MGSASDEIELGFLALSWPPWFAVNFYTLEAASEKGRSLVKWNGVQFVKFIF